MSQQAKHRPLRLLLIVHFQGDMSWSMLSLIVAVEIGISMNLDPTLNTLGRSRKKQDEEVASLGVGL